MTRWPRTLPPSAPPTGTPPLKGARIVWTRPEEAAETMAQDLAAAGAEVLLAPAIEFHELGSRNTMVFLESLDLLRHWCGWVVLPSPTAVRFFKQFLSTLGLTAAGLQGVRLAVVGEGSAAALAEAGLAADFIAPEPTGASLAQSLPGATGTPVLIAGSSQSRPELRDGLKARTFRVQFLALYDTRPCADGLRAIERSLERDPAVLVLAASPSAVDAVMDWFDSQEKPRPAVRWLAIGPTTRARLLECGVADGRIARAATPDAAGLIQAAACLLAHPWPPEAAAP